MNHVSTHPPDLSALHIITLGACLDAQAEHLLESAVYQAQKALGRHIILDLRALSTIDSRGLGKLFLTYHHLNRQNIRLSLVNPRPMVREMLEFVNFSKLVQIYDSLDEIVGPKFEGNEISKLHSSARR